MIASVGDGWITLILVAIGGMLTVQTILPLRIMNVMPVKTTAFGILAVLGFFFAHIVVGGGTSAPASEWMAAILAGPSGDSSLATILWQIRFPRALACVFAGGILGSVGFAFQLVFRNPLAEPFSTGISGGASVLGALALGLGLTGLSLEVGVLAASMLGGGIALLIVLSVGGGMRSTKGDQLIVAGVVVGTVLASMTSLIFLMQGKDSGALMRWLLGSMTPMFWSRVLILAICGLSGAVFLATRGKALDAMAFGDLSAHGMGVNVAKVRREVLIVGTLMTGAAVGATGIIGFLGMVAPHLARKLFGPNSRQGIPMSFLMGSGILLVADILAQRIWSGIELPVGAVTAVLGGPVLYVLLRRRA